MDPTPTPGHDRIVDEQEEEEEEEVQEEETVLIEMGGIPSVRESTRTTGEEDVEEELSRPDHDIEVMEEVDIEHHVHHHEEEDEPTSGHDEDIKSLFRFPGEKILWAQRVPLLNYLLSSATAPGASITNELVLLLLLALPVVSVAVTIVIFYLLTHKDDGHKHLFEGSSALSFVFIPLGCTAMWMLLTRRYVLTTRIDVITNVRVANVNIYKPRWFLFNGDYVDVTFLPMSSVREITIEGKYGVQFKKSSTGAKREESIPLTSREDEESDVGLSQLNAESSSNDGGNSVDVPSVWFTWVSTPEEIKTTVMEEIQKISPTCRDTKSGTATKNSRVNIDQVPVDIKDLIEPVFQNSNSVWMNEESLLSSLEFSNFSFVAISCVTITFLVAVIAISVWSSSMAFVIALGCCLLFLVIVPLLWLHLTAFYRTTTFHEGDDLHFIVKMWLPFRPSLRVTVPLFDSFPWTRRTVYNNASGTSLKLWRNPPLVITNISNDTGLEIENEAISSGIQHNQSS